MSYAEAAEASASGAEQPKGLARLRLGQRWRNLHDSVENTLDNIERNHFDGNFLQAVSNVPRIVGERAGRIGEELGEAAVKLVEEAQGRAEGSPGAPAAGQLEAAAGVRAEDEPALAELQPAPPLPQPDQRSASSLWEDCEELRARVAEEREMRRGRAFAIEGIDEAIRAMASEIEEEPRLLAEVQDARTVAGGRLRSAEVTLEELQEEHEKLQNHEAQLRPEIRRLEDAAAAKARAERQASREGAWAREGPETEALKLAKMELAEILSACDEAQLRSRHEQAQLARELEAAQEENDMLRKRMEGLAKPRRGLKASVLRLLTTARGREAEVSGPGSSGIAAR